VIRS
jgi:signal transduction histidine kinase